MNEIEIRRLTQADWKIWKVLRLESLVNSPENFASSYEEEVEWSVHEFKKMLKSNDVFGAFLDGCLIACAGFYSLTQAKIKHRGFVFGIYTKPEYRGQGIARSLMHYVINHAKSKVTHLHLVCATDNLAATKFYQSLGFEIYAEEPDSLKIGDEYFNAYRMTLKLI